MHEPDNPETQLMLGAEGCSKAFLRVVGFGGMLLIIMVIAARLAGWL